MNVLSIDVGHGHVKALLRRGDSDAFRVSFPSFVVPTSAGGAALAMSTGLDVLTVEVGGMNYRIGKDVEMVLPSGVERNRDERYSRSDQYLALARGAMHYSRCSTIDLLVVGLPLSTLATNASALKERLLGHHDVGLPKAGTSESQAVTVKDVLVIAQPVGALFAAGAQDPSLRSARVLTLDLGFHTLDVLASVGMRPLPERLGAIPGGVASYIDHLQRAIGERIKLDVPSLAGEFRTGSSIYEAALRQRAPRIVSLGPGDYDIDEFSTGALARLDLDLEQAKAIAGSGSDFTAVVLAGGGASLLEGAIRKHLPGVKRVLTLNDPQFAIARGYLLAGEMTVKLAGREAQHAA